MVRRRKRRRGSAVVNRCKAREDNTAHKHKHTQFTYPKKLDLTEDTVGIDQIAERVPHFLDGHLSAGQLSFY